MKKISFTLIISMIVFLSVNLFPNLMSGLIAGDLPKGISYQREGTGYVINFTNPGYKMTDVSVKITDKQNIEETFTKLESVDYGITLGDGRPQLPQVSFFVLIGKNEQIPTYRVLSQNKETIGLQHKIYPRQAPWEKVYSLNDRPFTIDWEYYNTRGNIDEPIITISEPFILAGAKGVMVTVYPYGYNPSSNELNILRTASIKIELTTEPVLDFVPSESYNNFYNSLFINYQTAKNTGTNRYLIITAPGLEGYLTPFVTHKTNLGYIVSVVNTTVTGTTNTAIKTYIQNLYNNINTRPEFVLLVGDIAEIPCWTGGGTGTPSTDLNYSLLEGSDLFADVFLGRFPIANTDTSSIINIINKTVYMENAINALWKKNVFMASTDNHTVSEGTHNFVIDTFFIPNGFTVNTKLYSYYGATTAQVTQSIDSGKIFAIYSGHGSETSWADGPPFSQANVNALNNTIFPFVYSFACITGSYHISGECFAETWIRRPKAGVVFWGSSVNSYWDEDDILEKRVVKSLFVDNLKKNAENYVRGKYYYYQHWGMSGMTQRYLEMYNCMGDPSIYQLSYGPAISHTPLPNTENMTGPYTVNCVITPAGNPISSTKLFWTRTTVFDSLSMTNSSGNNWTGNIPGNGSPAIYKYYIRTTDNAGLTTFLPGGAPTSYFSFMASTDTTCPVITHTPLQNTPKLLWPATVTASATDNIGIDSVWVRWYKNSSATGIKHFKLNNLSGNNYSGVFNSLQSEVEYNDSIFYRVFAQDAGSLHRKDSTALYSFKIVAQTTATIGTGTTSSNYPFTTYWMDGRTDMLFTASEIIAGMGAAGNIIKVGFNVITADLSPMNGFKVKMQNTNVTSISNFVTTGWTTCYDGVYSLTGTGWQFVELTSPFYWDGTSNLLVEVCYNNSSYTQYSPVNATTISGMAYGRYNDLSSGDGCTANLTSGTGALSYRPNISLVINLVTGINQLTTEIPESYSLSQNYPNPFNPVTKINFALPKQSFVTMKIYDILGREIKTLVNEVKSAGNYIIDFNASELASGVYYYRIEAGDFKDVKKMILIK